MYLTILNKETLEELDKCQTTEWLEAVQYVELNKLKYLSTEVNTLDLSIVNKKGSTYCNWTVSRNEKRSLIMNDRSPQVEESKSKSKTRTKSK